MRDQWIQKLDDFLVKKGLRRTPQRYRVVDAVFASSEHFTAEELYERLIALDLKSGVKTSRATVYRTLSLMVEAGLLKEIDFGGDCTYYDPNFHENPGHGHIICLDCGKIIEFSDEDLSKLETEIVHRLGFESRNSTLRITGNCERLRQDGLCPELIEARLNQRKMVKRS